MKTVAGLASNTTCNNSTMFNPECSPKERFLLSQKWFTGLPPSTQKSVVAETQVIHAHKGERVLVAGELVQGWYGVQSGLVKIEGTGGSKGGATFIGFSAGDWFGEGAVLKNEPRRYDVVALRDTDLLCVPSQSFWAMYKSDIGFNHCLIDTLNHKLGQAMSVIDAERTRTPEQRVALSLSRLFWSRTRKLDLTQEELASFSGMARQTANRALKELQNQGVISLQMNRITVLDDRALMAIVREEPKSQ